MREFVYKNYISVIALFLAAVAVSFCFSAVAVLEKRKADDEIKALRENETLALMSDMIKLLAAETAEERAIAGQAFMRSLDRSSLNERSKRELRSAARSAIGGETADLGIIYSSISERMKKSGRSSRAEIDEYFENSQKSPLGEYSGAMHSSAPAPSTLHRSRLSSVAEKNSRALFGKYIKLRHAYTAADITRDVRYCGNAYIISGICRDKGIEAAAEFGVCTKCADRTMIEREICRVLTELIGGVGELTMLSESTKGDTVFFTYTDRKGEFLISAGFIPDSGEIVFLSAAKYCGVKKSAYSIAKIF